MVRRNYTFSNSKTEIERIISKNPEYLRVLQTARKDAEFARKNFADKVEWLSGWWHNFCCPACASQMSFDINMQYNPPNNFTCPNCGKTASGIDYDEAWVFYYRLRFSALLQSCAICALFGDKETLDFIIRYLDFYADTYDLFPVHGKHVGKGKIMEQGLDEAVWAIDIISSLNACGELIPEDKRLVWFDKLFKPMTQLLIPQAKSIHNIPTWLLCAVGVIGIYFHDDALLDYALNSEFGIRNQVAHGFTKDGIWYEGSMTYHYYTASALSKFFSFYALCAPEDDIFNTFAKMYTTPRLLSYDGYHIPAVNDGWYPARLSVPLLALRICDDKTLLEIKEEVIKRVPDAMINTSTLLYGYIEDDVTVLPDTRMAVITKPFHVFFKAGVLARSHMHSDYLSIRISPFSDDLGTPGYAHPMASGWYRTHASHNAVGVDCTQPGEVIATRMEKIENGARATVEPRTWSDLELAQRTVTVDGDSVLDVTELKAPTAHTYDWIFHSIGDARYSPLDGERVESLGEGSGYSYFEDIWAIKTDGTFEASFTSESGDILTLKVLSTDGIRVYVAKSPDNPADRKRNSVILRRVANDAKFSVAFTVINYGNSSITE